MARHVTRTTVLALTACTALTGLTSLSGTAHAEGNARNGEIHNVIYLLGDGMGRTHVTAGRQRFYGAAGKLNMEKLPVVGQVSTYAVEKGTDQPALVTDSASAATAWASGVKTYNAAIGVDTHENSVPTVMEQAKAAGFRTGNVSTAEITDATPAGMFSHALLRGCQGPTYSAAACLPAGETTPADPTLVTPIAEQIARNGVADVILGGGLARFEPADEQALKARGYQVLGRFGDPAVGTDNGAQTAATQRVATRSDLQEVRSGKVIGLFNRGNLTVERSKQLAPDGAAIRAEPTLAELTTKAISLLGNNSDKGKGFLLQVEGALIDKRSHANDAAQTLEEIKAFDDAVKVASDFAKRDGHTLVIVTADHECAGFNIIEKGSFTNAEAAAPPGNVDSGNTANNGTPLRASSGKKDPARSSGTQNGAGLTGPNPAGNFAPATFRTADDPSTVQDGSPEASLWLTYLSGNHTGADVPVFAGGNAYALLLARQLDNTGLHGVLQRALGLPG
ncbi:MAG: alkaline phosphatase [Frankiales bacterium]|nr:alkaline phosphatase [Frankiales bacterium]